MAAKKPHDWFKYHTLPGIYEPVGWKFNDKHNKWPAKKREGSLFLEKDEWIPWGVKVARELKDEFVYTEDRPKLDLFYNGLKPEDKEYEIGGVKKPFKIIY